MDRTPLHFALIAKNWRDLIRPRALEIDHAGTHATYACEPLERGFGTTLGVMLRRTLLSALRGPAITHVAIADDAAVDVDALLLALKGVELASASERGSLLRLDKRGPGLVTAGDIACVDGIACCNPDYPLCSLPADGSIAIELAIGIGRGYAPAERHARPDAVAVDAMFSPVRRVDVGHQTDFDRLVLDVWTTGAIDPTEALSRAATILHDQLGLFLNFDEVPEPVEVPPDETAARVNENLWRTVEEIEFSVRASNCLRNLNLTYVGELVQRTESELLKARGFGRKSLTEIASVLAEMQLHLGMKLVDWPGTKPSRTR